MLDLDWLIARPIAHRGLHDAKKHIIENTKSAFAAAIDGHYAIECDLQISRDGEALVFHDETLDRLMVGKGLVCNHAMTELASMKFQSGADHIQSLSELLAQVRGRVPLVPEIKSIWDGNDAGWKRAVLHYLGVAEYYVRSKRGLNRQVWEPPKPGYHYLVLSTFAELDRSLSGNSQPTPDDLTVVQSAARHLCHREKISREPVTMQWIPGQGYLRLRMYVNGKVAVPTAANILQFFMSYDWSESIPDIQDLKVVGTDKYSTGIHQSRINLFTPSSFKGLEADGVVMFLGNDDHRIVEKSCVGLSRARFFLHVIGGREQLARLPKLMDKQVQRLKS